MDKKIPIPSLEGKTIKEASMWQEVDGVLTLELIFTDDVSFGLTMPRPTPTAEMVLLKGPNLDRIRERTFKGKIQD